jgi:hypothetical protein
MFRLKLWYLERKAKRSGSVEDQLKVWDEKNKHRKLLQFPTAWVKIGAFTDRPMGILERLQYEVFHS